VTSPPKAVVVDCPRCQHRYEDWYRPSLNLDIEHFGDEYIDSASSAVCPACGHKVYFQNMVVRDGVFLITDDTGDDHAGFSHPVEELFEALPAVRPYPPGVLEVPEHIPGVAFFPGGAGLWGAKRDSPLPPMPVGGVMVLGHDFHCEAGYQRSFAQGTEIPEPGEAGVRVPTWTALEELFAEVGISLSNCFFTNAYMGLREGNKSTGPFIGARDPAFMQRCREFLILQLHVQRPSLVITLGNRVPCFIAPLAPELHSWTRARTFREIDMAGAMVNNVRFAGADVPACTVIALLHPSMRNSNLKRRSYGESRDHKAEVALLREAAQLAGLPW